jgi:hypothetical protein
MDVTAADVAARRIDAWIVPAWFMRFPRHYKIASQG